MSFLGLYYKQINSHISFLFELGYITTILSTWQYSHAVSAYVYVVSQEDSPSLPWQTQMVIAQRGQVVTYGILFLFKAHPIVDIYLEAKKPDVPSSL